MLKPTPARKNTEKKRNRHPPQEKESEPADIPWFRRRCQPPDADFRLRKTHPRDDPSQPLTGVFATRSQDRPNPIGLHRVRLLAIEGDVLHVSGLEAIDGTPVIDIKPALAKAGGW